MKSIDVKAIENLMHEHEVIRAYIRSASGLIADRQPGEICGAGTPETLPDLVRMQLNLREMFIYFEDGLKQHHRCEEEIIPVFLGGLLVEPIMIEHREMLKELGDISYLLSDINPEGVIMGKSYIRVIINSFVSWVIDHSTREDKLFRILVREFDRAGSYLPVCSV